MFVVCVEVFVSVDIVVVVIIDCGVGLGWGRDREGSRCCWGRLYPYCVDSCVYPSAARRLLAFIFDWGVVVVDGVV